jgi:quinol monooxygenase YgiN
MGIVRLTGQLLCATDADAALVAGHVPTHIALSRAEPGCITFDVVQTANPLIWQVDESFTDQAAFDAHQTRTRASEWFALSAHIPRQFTVTHD